MAVAAIFDIDGTLVAFKFDAQACRRALIAELGARGVDTSGLTLATPTQGILDAAKVGMKESGPGGYELYREKVFSMLDEFELENIDATIPFPGVRDSLLYLRSKGVRLAVLTNSGRKASSLSIKRAEVGDCLEFVLTREDTEAMKPSPQGLEQAVSMLSLPKEEVYYVGDSTFDVMAANRAGVKMVAVTTGSYSAERLKSEGADYVVPTLAQLPRVLGV